MKTIIPAGQRILVKVDVVLAKDGVDIQEKDAFIGKDIKFILPKESKKEIEKDRQIDQGASMTGKVLAVGEHIYNGVHDGKIWCKVGDTVMFLRYAGTAIPLEIEKDDHLRIIEDIDVLAVIKD